MTRKEQIRMLTLNDILADMHTHTIASKHAYSTLYENLQAAEKRGMKTIAVTDHYWGYGDDLEKKNEVARIQYMGRCSATNDTAVAFIPSAEFNLGSQVVYRGERLKSLKWRLIGLHTWFENVDSMSFEDYVRLFKKAVDDGYNAFAHIEREMHRFLYGAGEAHFDSCVDAMAQVVDVAVEHGITVELNESSLITNEHGGYARAEAWLKHAKERGARISLGTDAHFCGEVGRFDKSLELLNRLDYPKELILNCDEKALYDMSCMSDDQKKVFLTR